MIAFILGSMLGGCIGVITMALIVGGKGNEYRKDDDYNEQDRTNN